MRKRITDEAVVFEDAENGYPTTVRALRENWRQTIADCRAALTEIEEAWNTESPNYDAIERTLRCVNSAANDMRGFAKGYLVWG